MWKVKFPEDMVTTAGNNSTATALGDDDDGKEESGAEMERGPPHLGKKRALDGLTRALQRTKTPNQPWDFSLMQRNSSSRQQDATVRPHSRQCSELTLN